MYENTELTRDELASILVSLELRIMQLKEESKRKNDKDLELYYNIQIKQLEKIQIKLRDKLYNWDK